MNLLKMFCFQTRWLVRSKLMLNILLNWEELKAYFACASQNGSQDVRYKARIISDMLHDDITYLYFQFATPVVSEFERINASFQATNADPKRLFDDLNVHYNSLKSRVYNHKNEILSLSSTQFGAKFLAECEQCLRRRSNINIDDVKARCQSRLIELVRQVEMRLPDQKDIFGELQALAPSKVLSQLKRVPFNNLPYLHIMGQTAATCEEQYRKILFHPWTEETDIFPEGIITNDIVQFGPKSENLKMLWKIMRTKNLPNMH